MYGTASAAPNRYKYLAGRSGGLDAIRLAAAALVFVAHAGIASGIPALAPLGAWGVLLFFVLSGYLIPTVYARGGPYFRRRLARILPGYWFAVIGLGVLTGVPVDVATLAMLQPIDQTDFDVFLGVAWTLRLELIFYALVPILALVPTRWITALGVASLILYATAPEPQIRATFPWRFWMFVPGLWLARYGLPAFLHHPVPRWVTFGATISYGVYLWHHEILRALRDMGMAPPAVLAGGAVLTIVAATVSWYLVERPALGNDRPTGDVAADEAPGSGRAGLVGVVVKAAEGAK